MMNRFFPRKFNLFIALKVWPDLLKWSLPKEICNTLRNY